MFLIPGDHEIVHLSAALKTAEVGSGRFPVALPLLSVTSRWDVVGSLLYQLKMTDLYL